MIQDKCTTCRSNLYERLFLYWLSKCKFLGGIVTLQIKEQMVIIKRSSTYLFDVEIEFYIQIFAEFQSIHITKCSLSRLLCTKFYAHSLDCFMENIRSLVIRVNVKLTIIFRIIFHYIWAHSVCIYRVLHGSGIGFIY